ncbi:hypothetical protein JXA85_01525 [Candidatus Woesearchaeota archaeon]|nr:hypothetical protein [Candidatus Woesearchaeota archaeon]
MNIKILGNEEFVFGMRLSGIGQCFVIEERQKGIKVTKELHKDDFIIANTSVIEMVPELQGFRNLITLPDEAEQMGRIDDLRRIIKAAVGMEIEVK